MKQQSNFDYNKRIVVLHILTYFLLMCILTLCATWALGQTATQKRAVLQLLQRQAAADNNVRNNVVTFCPYAGIWTSTGKKLSNMLKNRTPQMWNLDTTAIQQIHIDSILKTGYDAGRWNANMKVEIVGGYVIGYNLAEPEACQCYSLLGDKRDIHITIANQYPQTDKSKTMVVELTRFTRSPTMDIQTLFQNVGHRVLITGYLFYDNEHTKQAKNTAPPNVTNIWRRTAWEVHPVISIINQN